jgi:hypothetical protein
MIELRITRTTALLAGNGLVFLKLIDLYVSDRQAHINNERGLAIVALFPPLGLASAYGMLIDRSRPMTRVFEVVAIGMFMIPIALWRGAAYTFKGY